MGCNYLGEVTRSVAFPLLPDHCSTECSRFAGGSADRIDDLPDAFHQHALSFLPSREATCVLARCWRLQWRSLPALRITDAHTHESVQDLNKFALRGRSPLHECEIESYDEGDTNERFRCIESWIRYALSCQVRLLRVHGHYAFEWFGLPCKPLFCQHFDEAGA